MKFIFISSMRKVEKRLVMTYNNNGNAWIPKLERLVKLRGLGTHLWMNAFYLSISYLIRVHITDMFEKRVILTLIAGEYLFVYSI